MAPSPQPTKGPSGEPHCCPVVPKVQELLAPWTSRDPKAGAPGPTSPSASPPRGATLPGTPAPRNLESHPPASRNTICRCVIWEPKARANTMPFLYLITTGPPASSAWKRYEAEVERAV